MNIQGGTLKTLQAIISESMRRIKICSDKSFVNSRRT